MVALVGIFPSSWEYALLEQPHIWVDSKRRFVIERDIKESSCRRFGRRTRPSKTKEKFTEKQPRKFKDCCSYGIQFLCGQYKLIFHIEGFMP